jgi:hypothetical protein
MRASQLVGSYEDAADFSQWAQGDIGTGSHAHLIARAGLYAELYGMQPSRHR